MIRGFLALPRRMKQLISVAVDLALLTLAFWSALALRFETFSPEVAPYASQMVAAPLLAIPIFIRLGLYRAVIRFMEDRVVFVVAGGVAANKTIRRTLEDLATKHGFGFLAPPMVYCTDNAAMIALAGAERLEKGLTSDIDVAARPRWPLDEARANADPVHKKTGRKGAKA